MDEWTVGPCATAKATGYRFGKHVGAAHPLVAALCRAATVWWRELSNIV